MKPSDYQKFTKKKNSVVKEEFRQSKKKAKKERAEAINKRFEEKRRLKEEAANLRSQIPNQKFPKTGLQPAATIQPQTKGNKQEIVNAMPLNKFLAHCGVCSRREAVDVIKEGKVKVNNAIITEPAFKVSEKDDISFNGKKLFITKNLVYILLNKPKDYITTTDDPQGRKTVLQLTKNATTERIYPVGRLDRNTSGVLLLTNDGELTQKLSHPSYEVKKVYEAKLDKPLTKTDFEKILSGVKLEDGLIKADSLGYVDARDKSVIGIEIHSGRNRIVRRIFEHLHYDVKGLDRVMYGTLTKKNVERGKWRFLSEKEVRLLKYLNKSKVNPNDKAAG
ncbi:pseudouridine synthase [Ferruginibacter albus]|uniref:pseudouridine synthase n=1 Tax=Ferruginibacter albus TaxID=2875540 RepID=UPI001CC3DF8C|nr:pseudouridine synthase [Ferruginibacter albus]UAY51594.1 rRNA pseudouridine synthase [Ferruginibacter albus]